MASARDVTPLLHGFQERRLRLGRSAIDLVCQHDVREDRPVQEAEGALAGRAILLQHLCAGDVGRHQVGSELNAIKGEVHAVRERADHERLGESRNADEQRVPAAQERD